MIFFAISLAAAVTQAPEAKPVDAADKLVCKRISRTGSRMPAQRICMTASDWKAQATNTQRELTDLRTQSRPEGGPVF